MTPSVAVIIPCYNAALSLPACLRGLASQDYPAEIIVVDDASTDSTRTLLTWYPEVAVVTHADNQGPAAARNTGVAASQSDLLVFLDADCVVRDPAWLSKLVRAHQEWPGVIGGAVQGMGRGLIARADGYCHWFTNVPHSRPRIVSRSSRPSRLQLSRHLVTAHLAMTRTTFMQIGPFNPMLRTGEDVEFCERAIARGMTLRFAPEIIVHHQDRECIRDFVRCFYRVGRDRVRARHGAANNRLMPRGLGTALFMALPIALLMPFQPIGAWWRYDKRAVWYYPLIALAYGAMAFGIVADCAGRPR